MFSQRNWGVEKRASQDSVPVLLSVRWPRCCAPPGTERADLAWVITHLFDYPNDILFITWGLVSTLPDLSIKIFVLFSCDCDVKVFWGLKKRVYGAKSLNRLAPSSAQIRVSDMEIDIKFWSDSRAIRIERAKPFGEVVTRQNALFAQKERRPFDSIFASPRTDARNEFTTYQKPSICYARSIRLGKTWSTDGTATWLTWLLYPSNPLGSCIRYRDAFQIKNASTKKTMDAPMFQVDRRYCLGLLDCRGRLGNVPLIARVWKMWGGSHFLSRYCGA